MSDPVDHEGNETRALHELVDFRDKDVLEIGCGDGRMSCATPISPPRSSLSIRSLATLNAHLRTSRITCEQRFSSVVLMQLQLNSSPNRSTSLCSVDRYDDSLPRASCTP
jgi:hypothetical protein